MIWWSGSSSNKKTRTIKVNTVTAAAALAGCAAAEEKERPGRLLRRVTPARGPWRCWRSWRRWRSGTRRSSVPIAAWLAGCTPPYNPCVQESLHRSSRRFCVPLPLCNALRLLRLAFAGQSCSVGLSSIRVRGVALLSSQRFFFGYFFLFFSSPFFLF